MKANLSLVLDEKCQIRLDLLSNIELSEIDKYTISKNNHDEIRKDFSQKIDTYLEFNNDYINTFKKESNKKGSIVITFIDENKNMRKLRVLYNRKINKLDTSKLIKNIVNCLKTLDDVEKTIEVLNKYKNVIFNSDFELKNIYSYKRRIKDIKAIDKKDIRDKKLKVVNNNLLLLIKNKFIYLNSGSNYQKELCYYYLRLIDSYIEKNYKTSTTKDILKINNGLISFDEKNIDKLNNSKINTINIYEKILKEDENGQLYMNIESGFNRVRLQDLTTDLYDYDREEVTNYEKR